MVFFQNTSSVCLCLWKVSVSPQWLSTPLSLCWPPLFFWLICMIELGYNMQIKACIKSREFPKLKADICSMKQPIISEIWGVSWQWLIYLKLRPLKNIFPHFYLQLVLFMKLEFVYKPIDPPSLKILWLIDFSTLMNDAETANWELLWLRDLKSFYSARF